MAKTRTKKQSANKVQTLPRGLLPPRYVSGPAALIYDGELPAAVFRTGIRIWGLGWRYRYLRAGPVSIGLLCAICEVGRSQLYGHLAMLVSKSVLRYTNIGDGQLVFDLQPGSGAPSSPENRTDHALLGGGAHATGEIPPPLLILHGGECEGGDTVAGLDEHLALLDRLQIREPTRTELATSNTVEYLQEWVEWWEWEQRDQEVGIGLVVVQLRQGIEAPAVESGSRLPEWYAEALAEQQEGRS